ncbi:hypothetical protein OIDMADRAFT_36209 [Oidiodendron maius Zn]|uniref:Xylanolytic transcriptional activator regulatory domain-containing protein n=1 Tax=Oidiodendron maius (strain Zn) TaxID=913774 RepID=A0A0C3C263_OIDMZ|nr:hypothetical protein OIDMADRAFT_36209 [Oidiodendron maius Zn]
MPENIMLDIRNWLLQLKLDNSDREKTALFVKDFLPSRAAPGVGLPYTDYGSGHGYTPGSPSWEEASPLQEYRVSNVAPLAPGLPPIIILVVNLTHIKRSGGKKKPRFSAARLLGDLVGVSTALGLYREVEATDPISFISELRRRIFAVVFDIDKGSSLLTGRPPALSYRYSQFKLPLDLSEEVIMQGGDMLWRAVENLDDEGWSTEGKLYVTTTTRARAQLAIVLNEILELSLGELEQDKNEGIRLLLSASLFATR